MNNSLIEHIKALNKQEAQEHEKRRKAAIARIKELRQRGRDQQKALACRDTHGCIS